MNIFYLDPSPITSVDYMSNKHIVKMILESAQLLCTAHHELDKKTYINGVELYKPTHKNHPSSVWVRENKLHYEWLYTHFIALCDEYTYRYGKVHETYKKLSKALKTPPESIPTVEFKAPPLAMPDQYKVKNQTVRSYMRYYRAEKLFTEEDKKRWNKAIRLSKEYIEEQQWRIHRKKLLV